MTLKYPSRFRLRFHHVRVAWLVCLACVVFALGGQFAAAADAPNIVLIMADDMGYECVGANGGTTYKTPHLDRLAATGLRFKHCYSQPICTPSRVKIMTGIYNQRNYIRFGLLDPDATTFAHLLKKKGYATCIVGKWQLKGGFDGPGHFGFDEYCLWQLTRRPNRYPNPGLEINGKEVDFKNGEYGPDIVTDYACDFIERHKDGDKPFLLYYPMMLPHWPFEPTPDSPQWDPKARVNDKAEKSGKGVNDKFFVDMVAYTDKMVGKLVKKLDDAGLRDNTLVIFTCDNGTMRGIKSKLGERTVIGGKGTMPDAGNRVPLIVNWPGRVPGGKVSHDLVDFSDFLPTLCDAAGASVPSDLKIDGRSFFPQLMGKPGEPRQWIHIWYARNGGPKGEEFVRNQRFKLYADGRFFDVPNDWEEKQPLDVSKLSGEAKKAHEMLSEAMKQFEGTRVLKKD